MSITCLCRHRRPPHESPVRLCPAVRQFVVCPPRGEAGEIRLYTDDNFKGRVVVLRDTTDDLSRVNFNDTVSSIQVDAGSWEVCKDADFKGDCKTLERGDYRSLPGMNDKISSVREIGGGQGSGSSGGRRAALELGRRQQPARRVGRRQFWTATTWSTSASMTAPAARASSMATGSCAAIPTTVAAAACSALAATMTWAA